MVEISKKIIERNLQADIKQVIPYCSHKMERLQDTEVHQNFEEYRNHYGVQEERLVYTPGCMS